MQDSARYWVQYWHKASIQKQLLHKIMIFVVIAHLPSSSGNVISDIEAAVAHSCALNQHPSGL
jgi:hypothetical protein